MPNKEIMLMIPGPIQPDQKVMQAMGGRVYAHYGAEWLEKYCHTTSMLKQVFGTEEDVYVLVGSGSSGLDACLGSAFSSGEKILVGHNGFFGERIKNIAESYALNVVLVQAEWGQPLQAKDFERAIQENLDAKAVIVVHLETSTTIVNPVEEIGQVAYDHELLYMVDTVSSLGGMPMHMDEWHIDLCVSASQKCLGAPPGLAPVAISSHAWEVMGRNPSKGHGWYLNLLNWRKYATEWADWHPYPITLATNNIMALSASLEELLAEGIDARMERYRCLALKLRSGLRGIGMPPYTPDNKLAPVLTAAYGPDGVPTSQIVSYLENVHRIKIAGGLGLLKDKIFRIGHMSPTVTGEDIDTVVAALAEFKA